MRHPNHRKADWSAFIHRGLIYKALGLRAGRPIPPTLTWQGKIIIPLSLRGSAQPTDLEARIIPRPKAPEKGLRGSRPFKSSAHRIQVRCPACFAWTPFGRLHQHYGAGPCRAEAAKIDLVEQTVFRGA